MSHKAIYPMHKGMPIWKHIKDNGEIHKAHMDGTDFGTLAELIGTREIKRSIGSGLLNKLFPDINILSIKRISRNKSSKYGDYNLDISYIKDNYYSKKVLIVEIKHGKIEISQKQIQRYSKYLIYPSAYFRKADEVKIIFMLFDKIDSLNSSSTYTLCEFNKELAIKISEAIPIKGEDGNNPETLFNILYEEEKIIL